MRRIQNSLITLLFIISAFTVLGLNDSDPININNQTVSDIPPVTEINKKDTTTADPTTLPTTVTSPTKPTTVIPTTKPSTSTSVPTPPITNGTTTQPTTAVPVTSAKPTGGPPTTPVPSHRRFDGPSFIGGIVLALGLVAIGFVAFKFYKARTELNYHTL